MECVCGRVIGIASHLGNDFIIFRRCIKLVVVTLGI